MVKDIAFDIWPHAISFILQIIFVDIIINFVMFGTLDVEENNPAAQCYWFNQP